MGIAPGVALTVTGACHVLPSHADSEPGVHESIYDAVPFQPGEIDHRYGPRVHLLADPFLLTLLAQLCAPETVQPDVNRLARELYASLCAKVVAAEFPRSRVEKPTRMFATNPHGVYVGQVLDPKTTAVVVDVARAGTMPAAVVYDALNHILEPAGVRQDHIVMSRTTNDHGAVTGVSVTADKVAGDAHDAYLLIPDPMGATGSSICAAADLYTQDPARRPRKIILMNLIVTPQYLRKVRDRHPAASVYAVRLDRGLSPPEVLQTTPGERWDEENGLDDRHYIVPGGGGFGELMNNAYV